MEAQTASDGRSTAAVYVLRSFLELLMMRGESLFLAPEIESNRDDNADEDADTIPILGLVYF
jgi:hypothetical protein